ncbi:steroid 21-hydroxylase isoform X2 [Festucalex cinctus]
MSSKNPHTCNRRERCALDHYKRDEKLDDEQRHMGHKMATAVLVLAVGAAVLMLVLALLQTFFKSAARNNCPTCPQGKSVPGPPSIFLLGNMLELTPNHLPSHLTRLAQRYGHIYQLKCGNTSMVVLNSSDVIREALVKKWSDFAGRPISFTGDIVSGGGRSISLGDYDDEWRAHRRLVHGALLRCCQQSLHEVIEKQAAHLCKVLKAYQGGAVDLSEDFTVAASNVITTLTFGKDYDKSSSELQELHTCLNEIVDLWGSCWISALDSFPLLRKLPNPVFSRLIREVSKRDDIIRKHLDDFKSQDNKAESTITGHLLNGLHTKNEVVIGMINQALTLNRPFMLLTDTRVHMATVDLLIGGTETTAAWLNWTVAFLLHRPEVQTRVFEELCTVPEAHYPKYSERHKLPVLSALVNEVLRLRPVAPLAVPHRAVRDSSIAGYFIPRNTVIIPNLFGAHHDPSVWTEPYSFKPERFLEGGGASPRALIPFGGGARLCLGESVAKMELFLFTAYLLRDFHFIPTEASLPDLTGIASVVLKVKRYKVIACPRPVHGG